MRSFHDATRRIRYAGCGLAFVLALFACRDDTFIDEDEDGRSPKDCAPETSTETAGAELKPRANEVLATATVARRWDSPQVGDLPLTIELPITRYVGPFATTGTAGERTLGDYARVHAIGKYARLYLRVSGTANVDLEVLIDNLHTGGKPRPLETYDPDDPAAPRKRVVLPPVPAGPLRTVSVTFPTEQLALARTKRVPSPNHLSLHAKARGSPLPPDRCATSEEMRIEWAAVDFYAQAPVVLVHGINDTPQNCWSDYAAEIERMGFVPDLAVDFSGLGDKPAIGDGPVTFNGSVAGDVRRISERLEGLSADYGTNQVHLVGHSKGGLDLVNFLAGPYPELEKAGTIRVLSLQTLATPHGGSVLADLVAPLKAWARQEKASGFTSWPSWGVVADGTTDTNVFDTVGLSGLKASVLSDDGPIDPGLSDLRTTSEAVRVDQAWPGDPKIPFATYGWDADFERGQWVNELAQLTTPPVTEDEGGKYSTDCRGNPTGSRRWTYYCIDEDEIDTFFWGTAYYPPNGDSCSGWNVCGSPLYRQLARGRAGVVTSEHMFGGSRSTLHVDPYAPGEWTGNDLTVSLPSARHPRANQNYVLAGNAPRTISNLVRFKQGGGVEPAVAQCTRTGANHISILRHGRTNMVECTAADTTTWIRTSAPVPDVPPDVTSRAEARR